MASKALASKSVLNFDRSSILVVHVGKGDNNKEFYVNKNMLCERSEFFKHAVNCDLRSPEAAIGLPADEPDIFRLWLVHVYLRELDLMTRKELLRIEDPENSTELSTYCIKLCKFYVMSEKFGDRIGKNAVVKAIYHTTKLECRRSTLFTPPVRAISILYNGTPGDSSLRSLMVDIWFYSNVQTRGAYLEILPNEFSRDFGVALRKRRRLGKRYTYMEKVYTEQRSDCT